MTTQEKKKYLKEYLKCSARADNVALQLEQIYSKVTKMTCSYDNDGTQNGNNLNGVENGIIAYIDRKENLERELDSYIDRQADIAKSINSLDDDKQIKVLTKRYVEDKSWDDIKYEMKTENIFRIHGQALENLHMVVNDSK